MMHVALLLCSIFAAASLAQSSYSTSDLIADLPKTANLSRTTQFLQRYNALDLVNPSYSYLFLAPLDAGWQSFYNTTAGKAIFGTSLDDVVDEAALNDLLTYHFVSYDVIITAGFPNVSVITMTPTDASIADLAGSRFVAYINDKAISAEDPGTFQSAAGAISNVVAVVGLHHTSIAAEPLLIMVSTPPTLRPNRTIGSLPTFSFPLTTSPPLPASSARPPGWLP